MKKSLGLIVICMVLVISVSTISVFGLTGSMGNARMVLYPDIGFFGTTIDKTLLINNVNDEPINIRIEADGNFSKIATIIDKQFVLQPGESKNARFTLRITKAGDYEGKINVFFNTLENNTAGVALSSDIIIHTRGAGSDDNSDTTSNTTNTNTNNGNNTGTNNPVKISFNPIYLLIIFPIILLIILLYLLLRIKKGKRSVRSS